MFTPYAVKMTTFKLILMYYYITSEAMLLKGCSDNSQYAPMCKQWVIDGYCVKGSRYENFMTKQCADSCGLCVPTESNSLLRKREDHACSNSRQYLQMCSVWAGSGYCENKNHYKTFMVQHCPDSCGLCAPTESNRILNKKEHFGCSDNSQYAPMCKQWVIDGYCVKGSRYENFMTKHCVDSCGLCVPTESNSVIKDTKFERKTLCSDYRQYFQMCRIWAIRGYCNIESDYKMFMTNYCPDSCGLCPPTESNSILES